MIVRESIKHLKPKTEKEMELEDFTYVRGFTDNYLTARKLSNACEARAYSYLKRILKQEDIVKDFGGFVLAQCLIFGDIDIEFIKYLIEIGVDPSKSVSPGDNTPLKNALSNYSWYEVAFPVKEIHDKFEVIIDILMKDKRVTDNLKKLPKNELYTLESVYKNKK